MRSVYLQRKKNIFKVTELPADAFAHSLGLAGTPKIKFVKKAEKAVGPVKAAVKDISDKEDEEVEEEGTQKVSAQDERWVHTLGNSRLSVSLLGQDQVRSYVPET